MSGCARFISPIAVIGLLAAGCVAPDAPDEEPDPVDETPDYPPNADWADDPLWDLDAPPTFRVTLPVDDWESALWRLMPEGDCAERSYLEGMLTFVDPTDGREEIWGQVGVRWRGRSALNAGPTSRVGIKLSFNAFVDGREFHGLRKVNLMGTEGDHSAMREHLALRVARDVGLLAPRSTYAHLYVNGEYMGFYPMTEEADDKRYLKHRFEDPTGSMFKVAGYCGGRGDFAYDGEDPLVYRPTYEPKAGTPDRAITQHLMPLIRCTNTRFDDDFATCAEALIDVDTWLTSIAVDVVLPDVDGMIGAGQNFIMYRPTDTGKFVIWPWDKDLALSFDNIDLDWTLAGVHPVWAPDFRSRLGDRLVRTFPDDYCEKVLDVAQRYDPEFFIPEVERHRKLIDPWIRADPFIDADLWGWVTDDVVDVIDFHHNDVVAQAYRCRL